MKTAYKILLVLGVVVAASCAKPHDGKDGLAGKDGEPGVIARVVPLCPGESVYPDTYVEVAFCVNNKLYAVYSANGGFQTELPPGRYNSNAIDSSCSFVVVSGCEVTNE